MKCSTEKCFIIQQSGEIFFCALEKDMHSAFWEWTIYFLLAEKGWPRCSNLLYVILLWPLATVKTSLPYLWVDQVLQFSDSLLSTDPSSLRVCPICPSHLASPKSASASVFWGDGQFSVHFLWVAARIHLQAESGTNALFHFLDWLYSCAICVQCLKTFVSHTILSSFLI